MIAIFVAYSFASAQDPNLVIPKNGAATVDALFDDDDPWQAESWVEYGVLDKESNTTEGTTGQWQASWNDDVISFIIEVNDDTPNNDPEAIPNSYERDCAELFFYMSAEAPDAPEYFTNTWQIRLQRSNAGIGDDLSGGIDGATGDAAGSTVYEMAALTDATEFEAYDETTKYTLEASFPFAVLAGESGWTTADEFFYMHMSIGDNTTGEAGGRTQQIYWLAHDDDAMWNNKQTFKLVQLGEATVGIEDQMSKINASAYVYNNELKLKNVEGNVAIYNINGSLVKKAVVSQGQNSMDISDLKSGVYVVKAKNLATRIVK